MTSAPCTTQSFTLCRLPLAPLVLGREDAADAAGDDDDDPLLVGNARGEVDVGTMVIVLPVENDEVNRVFTDDEDDARDDGCCSVCVAVTPFTGVEPGGKVLVGMTAGEFLLSEPMLA